MAALALAGCGSSSAGDNSGGSGSGNVDEDALDELLSQEVELPYPTSPTDLGGDRNITYIANGLAAGGNAEVAEARAEIYRKSGWTIEGPLDGQFTPSVQATLVEQAVLKGADGIIVDSIFPSQAPAAFKSARDAGIPIVCTHCQPEESGNDVYMIQPSAESLTEPQIALVLAAVGKDDATIVVVGAEFDSSKAVAESQLRLLEEQCPGCEIADITFPTSDLGQPTSPAFTNLLREYPPGQLDAVITPFAPATTVLLNLAEQAGRDDFKVVNTFGDAPISTQIRDGERAPLLFGDSIISQLFIGYAVIDTLARVFNGEEVPDYSNLPAAPIAQQNAADYVNDDGLWVPEDMESKFFELWGLNN
ncbi:sugar ABC transporter substrate-binding protein [Nocardioides immobilis]|uniref:sugar ABC transporter substrate-binding protein n=1 Tax=Nocardioides immobilis TaxID=2049295 RepID=UPI0015F8E484|nr:substrate-binding domain-containing protein [Nocardioides immobilis]